MAGGIDSYTVLLLHCDGPDGSTTFTDSSQYAHTMSRNQVKVRTTQSKFGGASANWTGTTGWWIQSSDSSDWDFGAGDFTIDLWVWFDSVGNPSTFVGQYSSSLNNGAWLLRYLSTTQRLQLDYRNTSLTASNLYVPWSPTTGVWYHVAVTRSGNLLRFFINGVQQGAAQTLSATLNNSPNSLSIGDHADGGVSTHDGYMDEIRISKGIARWTADFTPPDTPYDVGITYTQAPSGGIRYGGSTVFAQDLNFTRSGGVVLGGSAATTLSRGYSDTPSGGIVFGGADTTSLIRANTPSGGITFGGSVVLGPVKLTVRLLSGGVEIANWQHTVAGTQARVSWAQFQVPLPAVAVVRATFNKPKLRLKAKAVGTAFEYVASFGQAGLLLRAKPFRAVEPTNARAGKPTLRLKGKVFVLRINQQLVFGKPKLILKTKPIARAGAAGLAPSPPRSFALTPTACEDQDVLVPTAPKTTLLVPTARRSI